MIKPLSEMGYQYINGILNFLNWSFSEIFTKGIEMIFTGVMDFKTCKIILIFLFIIFI